METFVELQTCNTHPPILTIHRFIRNTTGIESEWFLPTKPLTTPEDPSTSCLQPGIFPRAIDSIAPDRELLADGISRTDSISRTDGVNGISGQHSTSSTSSGEGLCWSGFCIQGNMDSGRRSYAQLWRDLEQHVGHNRQSMSDSRCVGLFE